MLDPTPVRCEVSDRTLRAPKEDDVHLNGITRGTGVVEWRLLEASVVNPRNLPSIDYRTLWSMGRGLRFLAHHYSSLAAGANARVGINST